MAPRKSSDTEVKATVKGTRVSSRVATQKKNQEEAAANVPSTPTKAAKITKSSKSPALKAKKANANRVSKATAKSKSTTTATKSKAKTAATKSKSKTTPSRSTTKKAPVANGTNKRKRAATEEDEEEEEVKSVKKAKAASTTKKTASTKALTKAQKQEAEVAEAKPEVKTRPAAIKRPAATINTAPTQRLNCFVFGENGSGELGLGHMNAPGKRVIDVKRPRLNPKLSSQEVGVVQMGCGGMHAVALTHDNKILTWGVNDQGALGRVTKGGEQFKTLNDKGEEESDEEEDEMNSGLNALESTPAEVNYINIPEDTVFTKVAAGDSITMVLTSTGQVYGCGTFRSNEGILGFTKEIEVQDTLALVPGLKNIVDLTCGANHVLALDNKGRAYAFGSGQQNQLGRRIVERTKLNSLVPTPLNIPRTKVTSVSSGSYHSFAIDQTGRVWSWGLNSFGQTGIADDAGTDGGAIIAPTVVESLSSQGIKNISGGTQHSVAVDAKGQVLVWGRADGNQTGQDLDDLPEDNFFHDEKGDVVKRLLLKPTPVPDIKDATFAAASGDTTIAINAEGKAYSWGFSANYQTAQGTDEDIEEATLIDNTAVREEKLVWCGVGGQYGMLASVAHGSQTNGEAQAPQITEKVAAPKVNGHSQALPTIGKTGKPQVNGDFEKLRDAQSAKETEAPKVNGVAH